MQYWQIFSSFLIFCYYFTRLKAREISCKIWETRKIFLILHSAPCDSNYLTWIHEMVQHVQQKVFIMDLRKSFLSVKGQELLLCLLLPKASTFHFLTKVYWWQYRPRLRRGQYSVENAHSVCQTSSSRSSLRSNLSSNPRSKLRSNRMSNLSLNLRSNMRPNLRLSLMWFRIRGPTWGPIGDWLRFSTCHRVWGRTCGRT